MQNLVEVNHLFKKYKTQEDYAVNDLSFSVSEGEIVSLLGPNGAGKSTLVKMLLGVIRPTSGEVHVFDKDPCHFRNQDKKKLGVYLGGKSNLIYHLPVIDSVGLFKSIYKVPATVYEKNLGKYSEILQCRDFLHQRVATLSLGQRLRAELLCIMVYDPQLLVLDEPTLGMDIEGKRLFRDMLSDLVRQQGLSVLITTHDVNDMQKLCDRILMICKGQKIMDITNAEFEALLSKQSILLTDIRLDTLPEGVRFVEHDSSGYRYLVPAEQTECMKNVIRQYPYGILKVEEPRLEDILYEYYR